MYDSTIWYVADSPAPALEPNKLELVKQQKAENRARDMLKKLLNSTEETGEFGIWSDNYRMDAMHDSSK
jgi:hypothetical protein